MIEILCEKCLRPARAIFAKTSITDVLLRSKYVSQKIQSFLFLLKNEIT